MTLRLAFDLHLCSLNEGAFLKTQWFGKPNIKMKMYKGKILDEKHLQYVDDQPPSYEDTLHYDIYHSEHCKHPNRHSMKSIQKRRFCGFFAAAILLFSVVFFAVSCCLVFYAYERKLSEDQSVILNLMSRLEAVKDAQNSDTGVFNLSLLEEEFVINDKCHVSPPPDKISCYPTGNASKEKCEAKGCCWVSPPEHSEQNTPRCFFPADTSQGYKVDNMISSNLGYTVWYSRDDKSTWPDDVMTLKMETMEESDTRFHFKIFDPNNARFEVPIDTPKVTKKASSPKYKVDLAEDTFGIKVTRTDDTKLTLFDTVGTRLTYADQFIEITTALPTNYLYGLGEHRDPLLHDVSKGFVMASWARDEPPAGCVNCNIYGQHPFFIGLDDKTKTAYGVFLLNANALEVTGTPASGSRPALLTYRTVGGILDFYVFTGSTPADVVQQYLDVIGRPYLPPYWGLGFHLCRWGYNSAEKLRAVINRMRKANFPYDTQWNDIDYMDRHLDWTYDTDKYAGLPDIVKDLQANNQHYIMIVDPGIANVPGYSVYDEGVQEGVFIMYSDKDEPLIGKVWPGTTAYPDFFNPATQTWWLKQASSYFKDVPFEGLWTDMNEPSNFVNGSVEGCTSNKYDNPPFTPPVLGGSLIDKTICPSARHKSGLHYNLHSMYGHSELIASQMVMHELRPGKRTVVISRSTFPSSGKYAGHWTGDNDSSWEDLRYSIPGILNFQFFGIPFVGADICGFMGTTNPELCIRWTQLGAFYPFMRNHNTDGSADQDPAAPMFDQDSQNALRKALKMRYSMLPYLYTLLARAHINGTMVAQPLWAQYANDLATYPIDRQFMWGESIMILPVLDQGANQVTGYFPRDTWIDMDGKVIESTGKNITVDAPIDVIPVFYRAGSVIPTQTPEVTTAASRKNPFSLVVNLDNTEQACGSLYWDDGDSLNASENGHFNMIYFSAKSGVLTNSVEHSGFDGEMLMDSVLINNAQKKIASATVNGKAAVVKAIGTTSFGLRFDNVDMKTSFKVEWFPE